MKSVLSLIIICAALSFMICGCDGGRPLYDDEYIDEYEEYEEETGRFTYDDLVKEYQDGWDSACVSVFLDSDILEHDGEYIEYSDFAYNYLGEPEIKERFPNTEYPYEYQDLDEAWDQGHYNALNEIFWYHDTYYWDNEEYNRWDF